jgi:hypothetical protein
MEKKSDYSFSWEIEKLELKLEIIRLRWSVIVLLGLLVFVVSLIIYHYA